MSINRACLILNASFEPIRISSCRRALTLLAKDAAVIEEHHGVEVYPGIFLPSVIRLKHYRRIPVRISVLTRKNLYMRDRHKCQYCGEVFSPRELTLDHIQPESRGGRYSWENLVSCCVTCNRKKADRTPEEAGMTLLHKPKMATIHTARYLIRLIGLTEDEKWAPYLYN